MRTITLLLLLCATTTWADTPFRVVSTLLVASAVWDIETSQSAIHHGGTEANPLLGASRPRAYAVSMGLNAVIVYGAYRMRERHSRYWWVVPVMVTGAHMALGGANMRFVW